MPRLTREEAIRGVRLTAAGGKATIGRNPASIRKGQFMTSQQPPRQAHFASTADAIKMLAAALQSTRQQIEDITNASRKRR